jgi:spore coat protein H
MKLSSAGTGLCRAAIFGSRGCRRAAVIFAASLATWLLLQAAGPANARAATPDGKSFFNPTATWTVRLQIPADQWDAMEPKGGQRPFGGPGGPDRNGIGPGKPPAMPADFGPGTFVAPIFMEQGDANHDKRLTIEEIAALADRWFKAWDKPHSGKLTNDQLRDGLNAALTLKAPPPGFGGPPGGGRPGGGPPGNMFKAAEGKRNGIAGAMGIDFPWVRADLEIQGQHFPGISVRWKGNGTYLQSRGALKRSFKVNFAKSPGGKAFGRFGKLNFHSNVTDASWMNEVLSHRLFRDAGVPAPRTTYAKVYLSVPGKHAGVYLGLYSIVENIDNDFAVDRFNTKAGALFKPVAHRLFEDLGDDWNAYRQLYDPKTALTAAETARVIAFCKLVSHASDSDFAAKLDSFLDLDEFSRFMAATVWLSTMDSILAMDQNYLVYLHPTTHRFQFIPWDLDHSFGQFFAMGTPRQRENLSIRKPWVGDFPFLKRVFAIERFQGLYRARLMELNKTLGKPKSLHRQVDELAVLLRPAVAEESAEKLARFDKVVAGEPLGPAGFGGFGPPGRNGPSGKNGSGPAMAPPGMFGDPAKPVKGFVTARCQSVREQLSGAKPGDELGGFGGPPRGGPGRGDFKPPAGFGPGMFWAPLLMTQFDANKDARLTRDELRDGLLRWFHKWDAAKTGALSEDQLRTGLNKLFPPPNFGPPGPGLGPEMDLLDDSDF